MINTAKQLLKKHFGYDNFRPGQTEIISHILNKEDCLAIMPTGAGKSICYQIPALTFERNYNSNFSANFINERPSRFINSKWYFCNIYK